ncbi:hypothetical protein C8T65DRAFT_88384 [Cerioporus squamosus]|nr:hypothetical protein C8T65DRAFT_88384 [Cerioporus squamosus]
MPAPTKCNQCKQVFRTLPDCEAHAASVGHQPHPAYFCDLCPELFTTQKQRSAHMQGTCHTTQSLLQMTPQVQPPVPSTQSANFHRYLCNTCIVLLNSEAARLEHMQQTRHADFARLTPMNGPHAGAGPTPPPSSPQRPAAASSSPIDREHATQGAASTSTTAALPHAPAVEDQPTDHSTISTMENTRCEKCKVSFNDSNELQMHFNKSVKNHPHCRTCDLGFASITSWVAHKSTCPPPGSSPEEATRDQAHSIPSSVSAMSSRLSQNGRSSRSVTTDATDNTPATLLMSETSTTRGSNWLADASIRSQAGGIWPTSSRGPASTYNRSRDGGRAASTAASSAESEDRRLPEASVNTRSAASASIQDWQRGVPSQTKTKSIAVSSRTSTPTPTRSSFHCRSCARDPCIEPVATVCGHLFCHSCIVHEIETKLCCPVCQKAFLVRLHVESG